MNNIDAIVSKHQDNHTLAIIESDGYLYYITLLENLKGAPKGLREYRITHTDGLTKYMTIHEFKNTPFERFITHAKSLTKRVSDNKIVLSGNKLLFV
jgi:hypothetical protein